MEYSWYNINTWDFFNKVKLEIETVNNINIKNKIKLEIEDIEHVNVLPTQDKILRQVNFNDYFKLSELLYSKNIMPSIGCLWHNDSGESYVRPHCAELYRKGMLDKILYNGKYCDFIIEKKEYYTNSGQRVVNIHRKIYILNNNFWSLYNKELILTHSGSHATNNIRRIHNF